LYTHRNSEPFDVCREPLLAEWLTERPDEQIRLGSSNASDHRGFFLGGLFAKWWNFNPNHVQARGVLHQA